MAAETSRSAMPSAESYTGSLISLTSKCEIRYEGILYNINAQESSIGLRNVRSFGTEGRKKDGPQIPASDKVYEYILFRGSDIKDLLVKASPPAQTSPIHNDPAIIQSHYYQTASTSASMPTVVNGAGSDPNSHTAQLGLPRPTFQGSLPLYQPGGNLGSWGAPPALPTANGSGLQMPMYWQGFYAQPSGLPHLRPPPVLPVAQSIQQPLQYPAINTPLNFPELPMGLPSTTLPATVAPTQASLLASDTAPSLSLMPNISPVTSLSLVPPSTSTHNPLIANSQNVSSNVVGSKAITSPDPKLGYETTPQAMPSVTGLPSSNVVEPAASLLTPDQLLQPNSTTIPSSQSLKTSNNDIEVKAREAKKNALVQESSVRVQESSMHVAESSLRVAESSIRAPPKVKEPILPLPKSMHQKPNRAIMHTHHYNMGHGRGRGNGYSHPVTKFTEEFDFMAMNEKFNKDEVWGHLGKSKALLHDTEEGEDDEADDNQDDDVAEAYNPDIKPVYAKDDFFDTLSCNNSDRGSQGGRMKYSEQLKLDTETFGDFPRHRPNRGGGRGFRGGGRARGSHYGRGYGYVPRGRGHAVPKRAS